MEIGNGEHRPSIEQRAERRRDLQRDHPDRYTGLISVLRGGRAHDGQRARDDPAHWHPVMRQLVIAALVVIAVVAVAYVLNDVWREARIDTWSGPTDTVTSGQRVLACLPEGTERHEQLPTWIRYGDRVFARTEFVRPLRGQGQVDRTRQIETGYRLDRLRLLLPADAPPDQPPTLLLVVIEPAPAATIYDPAPECD